MQVVTNGTQTGEDGTTSHQTWNVTWVIVGGDKAANTFAPKLIRQPSRCVPRRTLHQFYCGTPNSTDDPPSVCRRSSGSGRST